MASLLRRVRDHFRDSLEEFLERKAHREAGFHGRFGMRTKLWYDTVEERRLQREEERKQGSRGSTRGDRRSKAQVELDDAGVDILGQQQGSRGLGIDIRNGREYPYKRRGSTRGNVFSPNNAEASEGLSTRTRYGSINTKSPHKRLSKHEKSLEWEDINDRGVDFAEDPSKNTEEAPSETHHPATMSDEEPLVNDKESLKHAEDASAVPEELSSSSGESLVKSPNSSSLTRKPSSETTTSAASKREEREDFDADHDASSIKAEVFKKKGGTRKQRSKRRPSVATTESEESDDATDAESESNTSSKESQTSSKKSEKSQAGIRGAGKDHDSDDDSDAAYDEHEEFDDEYGDSGGMSDRETIRITAKDKGTWKQDYSSFRQKSTNPMVKEPLLRSTRIPPSGYRTSHPDPNGKRPMSRGQPKDVGRHDRSPNVFHAGDPVSSQPSGFGWAKRPNLGFSKSYGPRTSNSSYVTPLNFATNYRPTPGLWNHPNPYGEPYVVREANKHKEDDEDNDDEEQHGKKAGNRKPSPCPFSNTKKNGFGKGHRTKPRVEESSSSSEGEEAEQEKPSNNLTGLQKPPNHYATLGIPPSSSPQEIADAAKKMRIKTHPDRLKKPGMSEQVLAKIDAEAGNVGHAADVLCDAELRREYDREVRVWEGRYGRLA